MGTDDTKISTLIDLIEGTNTSGWVLEKGPVTVRTLNELLNDKSQPDIVRNLAKKALEKKEGVKPSCSYVELDAADGPMDDMPVYDQDGLGICYAYAAAQLIDFERGKKERLSSGYSSPLYLAANTYYRGEIGGGGHSTKVLREFSQEKSCNTEQLSKYFPEIGDTPFQILKKNIGQIYAASRNYRNQESGENACLLYPDTHPLAGLNENTIKSILTTGLKAQMLSKALDTICDAPSIQFPTVRPHKVYGLSSTRSLDLAFDIESPKPVIISYCFEFLTQGNDYEGISGIKRNGHGDEVQLAHDCGRHASIVTGRRMKDGVCEYKIRNSHGLSCPQNYANAYPCDDGSYWVPRRALEKNVYETTQI